MISKMNLVIVLLFVLSAIVVLGSNDKVELMFHLCIVSILGFFSLYVYHKKTIEGFFTNDANLTNEMNKLVSEYKSLEQEIVEDNKTQNSLAFSQENMDWAKPLTDFDEKMLKDEALQALSLGARQESDDINKDGDFKCAFERQCNDNTQQNSLKCGEKRFKGYNANASLYSMGASLEQKIGEYDNITLDAENLQHRRAMSPGFDEKMVPKDQKCGVLSAPCSGVKIEHPFHVNPDGKEEEMVFSKNDAMKDVMGHKNPDQLMFAFSHNKFSPACCPSNYSTDAGCVCTTTEQRNFIGKRGNKSEYSL